MLDEPKNAIVPAAIAAPPKPTPAKPIPSESFCVSVVSGVSLTRIAASISGGAIEPGSVLGELAVNP